MQIWIQFYLNLADNNKTSTFGLEKQIASIEQNKGPGDFQEKDGCNEILLVGLSGKIT